MFKYSPQPFGSWENILEFHLNLNLKFQILCKFRTQPGNSKNPSQDDSGQ